MSDLLTLHAAAKLHARANGGGVSVTIRAYDGNEMLVEPHGWVIVESGTLVLPKSVPLVSDHQTQRESIIGAGTAAVHSGGEIDVSGRISKATRAGREVVDLAADGVAWEASIGLRMRPSENVKLRPGATLNANGKQFTAGRNGLLHVRRARLAEVSILLEGASSHTSVTIGRDMVSAAAVRSEILRLQARGWKLKRIATRIGVPIQALGLCIAGVLPHFPKSDFSKLKAL